MKKFLFILLIALCWNQIMVAQTTEDFETETPGTTTFSDNGQNFTLTNGPGETTYGIYSFAGGGWNGTSADNQFIDNSGGAPVQGDGTSCTITTTDGTDIYVNYLYLFVSTRSLGVASTTLTITGKKDGSTVYTIVKSSGFASPVTFSPNNGFTYIDFSTEGGSDNSNTAIDEIIISTTNNADYIAIDAFNWENAPTCTDPTVPTVTYSPATVCNGNNATLNISGTLNDATAWQVYTGSCGGTYIGSTAGSTFVVTPGSPSTTYYVRGEGGCVTPGSCGTTTVTVTPMDDASFSYGASSYCVNASDPTPTITGLTGGTFSSSPAGLSINASTGQVDVSASTPNTYTVTYTTSGACPNSSNVAVTINALDNASFSYGASSYCVNASDPTPTITGLTGGTFSSSPAGLSINASTGQVDVSASTPNTYTVTYTTAGTCPNSSNVAVTINALDNASFSYGSASYCLGDGNPTPTITGLGGGTFSSSPAGLSINASTGQITISGSTGGAYTVTYTTSGTCPNSSNQNVTINVTDTDGDGVCDVNDNDDDNDGIDDVTEAINGTSITDPQMCGDTDGDGCDDCSQNPFSMASPTPWSVYTPNPLNDGPDTDGDGICNSGDPCPNGLDDASFSYSASVYNSTSGNQTPTITGVGGGTYSSSAGLTINTTTGEIDPSTSIPGTYIVTYTTTGTCSNSSNVQVSILADLVITEIMYNGPESGTDTTEFIEIYNNDANPVDLTNYSFSQGVTYTFPSVTLNSGEFYVVAYNAGAFNNVFGFMPDGVFTGGLSNGGEDVTIVDANGNMVDSVDYENSGIWPTQANGQGSSIILCDVNSDNNDGNSWNASVASTGVMINGFEVKASPGAANFCCPVLAGTDTQVVCDSLLWIDGNTYYSDNTTATFTTQTIQGCDSTVTLNLTVNNSPTITITEPALTMQSANCFGTEFIMHASGADTYVWDDLSTDTIFTYVADTANMWFTLSVTGTDTLTGCSSVGTFNIPGVYDPVTPGSQTLNICNGESVTVGMSTYNMTGIYTDTLASILNGCDSVVTTDLTVQAAIDVTIDNTLTPTLTANQTGATYQWLDCDNGNAVIPSETGQSYTATVNGNYAVEITVGSCVDTSACEAVTGVGVREMNNQVVSIYPNPTNGMITIDLGNNTSIVNYTVVTIEGRILSQGRTSENKVMIDLSGESKGVYFLQLKDENSSNVYKVLKQ